MSSVMPDSAQVAAGLVAEARHRAANYFQLVISLAGLRARRARQPETRRELSWLADIVTVLSMLHAQSGPGPEATFGAYLTQTASFWKQLGLARGIDVEVEVSGEIGLADSAASALAIIGHELVANALDHGFPHGRQGRITVRFGMADGDRLELSVADDGIGFGQPADPADAGEGEPSSGLALVRYLAGGLGGTLIVMALPAGTSATVTFPAGLGREA